ncbi:MAG: glycoside hydrolase family 71/99-like protein [Bacteroidales bacterium]|nr:glycoside hydrolase family 71/99-like protein [Bacteroidales bacterium]
MNRYLNMLAGAVLALAPLSCGNPDDDIPGRVEEDKPVVEVKYNDLGFAPHKDGDPFDTYEGLVMAGYQGWFCAPGCGCPHNRFYHYQENGYFEPGVLKNSIDFWPDTAEYDITYETKFTMPDGSPAKVYSPYDESSVMTHFKWMQEYGIDGVYMQRFVAEAVDNPNSQSHFNKVLDNAMAASNKYQRAICVMYDLGGFRSTASRSVDALVKDGCDIYDKYQLGDRSVQKYYLHENGKPLIALWGVGFNDNRPYTISEIKEVCDRFKEKGYSIMLGVPTGWRTLSGDCLHDKAITELIKESDVFFPWFVGRYDYNSYDNFLQNNIKADIKWAQDNGKVYAPLCFPGFSWTHMRPHSAPYSRMKGDFLWKQAYGSIVAGAKCFYIAMFDEVDEGTAIFKVLNKRNVPSNDPLKDYYVFYDGSECRIRSTQKTDLTGNQWCELASSLNIGFQGIDDDLETDHYLWLTGQIRKMLRGEIPLSAQQPKRN